MSGNIEDLRNRGRKLRKQENPGPVAPNNVIDLALHRKKVRDVERLPHKNTTKFTPEVVEILLTAIRAGNYFTTACQYAGIHVGTLYRWLEWGEEDGREGYKEFAEELRQAEAEAEVDLVHMVSVHAKTDWRAGMELLSRRFPERWSSKQEVSGQSKVEVEVVFVDDVGRFVDDAD